MVLIGGKRSRVVVERNDATAGDSFGDPAPSWTALCTRWAKVLPVQGKEYIASQQVTSSITHRVFMRRDPETSAITPKHRLTIGSRAFDILSVIDIDERGREIEIMAAERI